MFFVTVVIFVTDVTDCSLLIDYLFGDDALMSRLAEYHVGDAERGASSLLRS
jgi:hypothetical protein